MLYGIYLNTAGAWVEGARQDVIANNLANAETTAYKRGMAIFRERLHEARENLEVSHQPHPVLDEVGGGVFLDEVAYSHGDGPLEFTGEDFDVALQGEGLFTLRDRETGATFYSRAGRFARSAEGLLVTRDGTQLVLDENDEPISIPQGNVQFGSSGEITVDGEPLTRLALRGTLASSQFRRVGQSRLQYQGDPQTVQPAQPTVRQGYLERSNVSSVSEMVRLVQSSRAYETNMRMIRLQDATLQQAVSRIAAVS